MDTPLPPSIRKVKLSNFKRFGDCTIEFNDESGLNVLIGNNESGKSSVLLAIDLVMSGSSYRVDSLGIESLINIDVVRESIDNKSDVAGSSTDKHIELPLTYVEVYLSNCEKERLNGLFNSGGAG